MVRALTFEVASNVRLQGRVFIIRNDPHHVDHSLRKFS